jgi:hypothetical protein
MLLALTSVAVVSACGGGDSDGGTLSKKGDAGKDAGGLGGSGGDAATNDSGPTACSAPAECEAALGDTSPPGCATAKCVAGECQFDVLDADGDGHALMGCTSSKLALDAGDDCNDDDATVHPGAWDGPESGSNADSCDRVDNDCNLTPDDGSAAGKTCTCDPAVDIQADCALLPDGTPITFPGGTPQGSCSLGKRDCTAAGAWGPCVGAVAPAPSDTCAAENDDDCDGTANNGPLPNSVCQCAAGTTATCASALGALGACGQGSVTCQAAGTWGTCSVAPQGEVCNGDGVDEDCDGPVNEGCTCTNGQTSTCGAVNGSVGACASKTATCSGGQWNTSNCSGTSEVCDCGNVDDNCNGTANEGCSCCNGQTQACGTCNLNSQTCSNGSWGSCSGNTVPQWCQDSDGDNYCGPCTSSCNFPGSGWKAAPCTNECNDGNPYTTACANTGQQDVHAGTFAKPWGTPCTNKYFAANCPAGKKLVDCTAKKISPPISSSLFNDLDDQISAGMCGVRICDQVFETATVESHAICVWY